MVDSVSMRRVLVIGAGGAGKSTLARRLATHAGLPLIHLDRHYWRAGWEPTPADEWRQMVGRMIDADAWVMDGNYGDTLDIRLEACDTVLFLDFPRHVCLWRVLRRRLRHLKGSRAELPAGCPERLTWSFVLWIWTYRARRRSGILRRLDALESEKQVYILRSSRDVETFMTELRRA